LGNEDCCKSPLVPGGSKYEVTVGRFRAFVNAGGARGAQALAFGDDSAFLLMERLEGESLAERARGLALPVNQLLDVLDQALDVLAIAHEQGILHGNLKPGNLFLTASGQVKVLDFGLARLIDALPESLCSRSGVSAGMRPYMAPERARGVQEAEVPADLFGLGASTALDDAAGTSPATVSANHAPSPTSVRARCNTLRPGSRRPSCSSCQRRPGFPIHSRRHRRRRNRRPRRARVTQPRAGTSSFAYLHASPATRSISNGEAPEWVRVLPM
jgi:serine/threonine protein kinase